METIQLTLPPSVERAVRLLAEAHQPAWFVGGAVRDLLLDRPLKDFDIVLAGDGVAWAKKIARAVGGSFVVLDETRRVGRVVVKEGDKPLWIDIAAFRGPDDKGDGTSLEEDLRLRDFTVNAIAIESATGTIVDPTGGVAHLERRELHPPSSRAFTDDPLRILRGVRLQATHGFTIPNSTQAQMRDAVKGFETVAMERVREEWLRLLAPPQAIERVRFLDALGIIDVILPELTACKGVTQSAPHNLDVFEHQLLVLQAVEDLTPLPPTDRIWHTGKLARFSENLAAHLSEEVAFEMPRWVLLKHVGLLHDIGKVITRSVGPDGRIHFYDHDIEGGTLMEKLMTRWKFPGKAVDYAANVVRYHLRPLHFANHLPPRSRTLYHFYRDAQEVGVDVGVHTIADQRGKAFPDDRPAIMEVVYYLWSAYFDERERYVRPTPLLDGHALMALTGLKGKIIGELLEELRERQAQHTITTREEAERWVRERVRG